MQKATKVFSHTITVAENPEKQKSFYIGIAENILPHSSKGAYQTDDLFAKALTAQ